MSANWEGRYQRVANKNEIKEGGLMRVEPEGKPIVLAMVKGNIYAMDAVCSHEGGPLEDGTLQGYELKCPWHYAIFDVRNAKVSKQTVWATDLQSYPVKVDDATGDIMISLQTTKPASGGGGEATVQDSRQDSYSSQKKYYEEEEQKGAAATIITNWSGERGRIDKSMLERHLTKDEVGNAVFYICGPPGMLKAIQELLQQELQIPKDRLKVEAFTGY